MSDDIPTWQRIITVLVISLIILVPYISLSDWEHDVEIEITQPVEEQRPLSINQLIAHYSGKYNVNEKLARDIIYCESNFNPYALNVKAVIGEDVGLFQLNSHYWQETMALNGWDIYDIEDNIEVGMWLLSKSGSVPWNWSKACWSIR